MMSNGLHRVAELANMSENCLRVEQKTHDLMQQSLQQMESMLKLSLSLVIMPAAKAKSGNRMSITAE